MFRTEQEWLEKFEEIESVWRRKSGQSKYHACLTKRRDEQEKHSDLYINSSKIVSRALILSQVCADLLEKLIEAGLDIEKIDCVIGPAHGATTLASRLAEAIAVKRNRECLSTYAIKNEATQVWEIPRLDLRNMCILGIEDTVTTLGNIKQVMEAIEQQGGKIIKIVGSICNRSGKKVLKGVEVVSLVNIEGHDWVKEKCPLCTIGSTPIHPKQKGNWSKLNKQNGG